jgi:hypothetical protein
MPRPIPHLKLVSQTDVKDLKHADDCGPSTDAMILFRGTSGRVDVGWREVRAAMAKRGIVDKDGESNFTTVQENIRAIIDLAPELKGRIEERPTWAKTRACLEAGGGVAVLYYYGAAPRDIWSPLVKSGTFAHFAYAEAGDDGVLFYDPMLKVGANPKKISWETLELLTLWGVNEKASGAKKTSGFIVHPAQAIAPRASLDEVLDVQLAPKTNAPKAKSLELDEEMAALGRVDWKKVGSDAGDTILNALREGEKAKGGKMDKIKASIAWTIANTGIDEAVIEALRVGLSTGIAVMLATGAPILDMTTADFRVVASSAIGATLQVAVRALNPDDPKFGVGRAKAARAAEKMASGRAK